MDFLREQSVKLTTLDELLVRRLPQKISVYDEHFTGEFKSSVSANIITLFSTFLHGGATADWLTSWLTLVVKCLPIAFFLQVLYVAPLVRLIFRVIFKKQLA